MLAPSHAQERVRVRNERASVDETTVKYGLYGIQDFKVGVCGLLTPVRANTVPNHQLYNSISIHCTNHSISLVFSHVASSAQVAMLLEAWEWTCDDVILHVLPLHHLHGILNALLSPLSCGATVIMEKEFDAGKVYRTREMLYKCQSIFFCFFFCVCFFVCL